MTEENVFKRKWTRYVIECFDYDKPEKVVKFSEIQKKICRKVRVGKLIDGRALSEILNDLVKIGFMKKHEGKKKRGYSISKKEHLNYIFKIQDKSIIENCPFSAIQIETFPYQTYKDKEVEARYLTFYGKIDKDAYEIVFNTAKQLHDFYQDKYKVIFEDLLKKELCIRNVNIENCLKTWGSWMMNESGLLHPQRELERNPDSYGPKTFLKIAQKYKLTQDEIIKAREKAQKIMEKLEKNNPPSTIVMRF